MQKEIDAALKAAQAYSPSGVEEPHVALIVSMLTDASLRASILGDITAAAEKEQKLRDARDALAAAEAA